MLYALVHDTTTYFTRFHCIPFLALALLFSHLVIITFFPS